MQTSLALEDTTPVADGTAADVARLSKKRRTLYRKLAFASLSLLLAGFVLQLVDALGYGTVAVTPNFQSLGSKEEKRA